jgi:hypothetical protein
VPKQQLAQVLVFAQLAARVQVRQVQVRLAQPKLATPAQPAQLVLVLARLVLNQFDRWNLKRLHEWFDHQGQCRRARLYRCRDRQLDDAQLVTEVCSKHLARSQFALQRQLLRLVEQPVQARAVQLALALAQVEQRAQALARAVQRAQARESAQVVQLAQVQPAQAQ